MSYNIVLILAIGLPALAVLWWRANAAIIFLSLCAGSLLLHYVAHDTNVAVTVFTHNATITATWLQLAILLAPAILTTVFLRHSMPVSKLLYNLLPAIAVGLVGVLVTVPILSGGISNQLTHTPTWQFLQQYQDVIVGTGAFISLLVLWLTHHRPHHETRGRGHRKHH